MFNVPVSFVSPCGGLDDATRRRYIFHEFASNGAKHFVLTCRLARMMLDTPSMIQDIWYEVREAGLSFVDAHAPFGELMDMNCPIPSFRPLMLETQKRTIELCAQLGIKTLTIHVGNNHWMDDPAMIRLDYNRACIENTLETLLPVAERNGVIICIENIWFQTNTPEELLRYKQLFPTDYLGFCYDAGHANMMAVHPDIPHPALTFWKEKYGMDEIPFDDHILEKMLPHIVNCHLHDNDAILDRHVNIGMGNINWQHIIPILKTAPRLQCIQSEVDSTAQTIGVRDVVDKFNWLGTLE